MASINHAFSAMACPCEIRLEAGGDPDAMHSAARAAADEVRRIETAYSRYRSDSIIARINAAAGGTQAIEVDSEMAALLDFAGTLHADSDGLFDITSGVLRRAWDFRSGHVPDDALLATLRPLIGWPMVHWRDGAILLPRAGMELDFGGFGKEYAADRAAGVLSALGQRHGYVNLGGDIRVLGARADGAAWRFGIQDPRAPNATIASVELRAGALATSGDYERFFVRDGRRYCHVLDPRDGWPVAHWRSVSACAPACVAAGALTTIAMLKAADALDYLAAQGVAYLAIDAGGSRFHDTL